MSYSETMAAFSIPMAARHASPLDVAEIDAHPDGARIWATIEAMRQGLDDETQDMFAALEEINGKVEIDHDDTSATLELRYDESALPDDLLKVAERIEESLQNAVTAFAEKLSERVADYDVKAKIENDEITLELDELPPVIGPAIETLLIAVEKTVNAALRDEGDDMSDHRENAWATRVVLLEGKEPLADTHPDLPPDAFGDWQASGLKGVAALVRDLAVQFHGEPPTGFDAETIKKRIASVRVTLSRRGGNAVWKIPYAVGDREYVAHALIERAA